MPLPEIRLEDYAYHLPESHIAQVPLEQRDLAKLLVYNQGNITHTQFFNLTQYLESASLLIFNNTKVIPARLYFTKPTGALIEIFLLNPESPHLISQAMQARKSCVWKCLVGNKKKWKAPEDLVAQQIIATRLWVTPQNQVVMLKAHYVDYAQDLIEFSWDNAEFTFYELLQHFGEVPLPPYLKRKAEVKDSERYQTVYSKHEGAVAAPTAGLHFTPKVLESLQNQNIETDFITLHVSGGTFQPIRVNNVAQHNMHAEQIIFSRENIEKLLKQKGKTIAVGTTSMRALESLFWFGVKLAQEQPTGIIPFWIEKLYPYQVARSKTLKPKQTLEKVLTYMQKHNLQELKGETEIFIFPSYRFQLCQGLITNYHLPATTLILLVAAFIGEDWRRVYDEALANNYRFLSYGDSSLLIPSLK